MGRSQELSRLEDCFREKKSHFTVLYGRRRIGKTELLKHYAEDKRVLFYSALDTSQAKQKKNFLSELAVFLNDPLVASAPLNDWKSIFDLFLAKAPSKKIVLILDEFQWMCKADASLLSVLQHAWDHHWQHGNKIHVILCGSSVSFMVDKVLSEKSPLFGRRTQTIELNQLSSQEAALFFKKGDDFDVIRYLICFGGVPAYLRLYDAQRSFEQNVNQLAFVQNGYFTQELNYILSGQLKRPARYHKLLRYLAISSLSLADLARGLSISTGSLIYNLDTLASIGLVKEYKPILASESAKTVLYKVVDPFTRFYFAFVYPHLSAINKNAGRFIFNDIVKGKWPIFCGLGFEAFCHQNIGKILEHFGIVETYSRSGYYWHKTSVRRGAGVQIDFVIERTDGVTMIGECKWSEGRIGYDILTELEEKCRRYPNPKKHKLKKFLVTTGDISHNLVDHPEIGIMQLKDFFGG